MDSKKISYRIPGVLFDKISEECKNKDIPISKYLTGALDEYQNGEDRRKKEAEIKVKINKYKTIFTELLEQLSNISKIILEDPESLYFCDKYIENINRITEKFLKRKTSKLV